VTKIIDESLKNQLEKIVYVLIFPPKHLSDFVLIELSFESNLRHIQTVKLCVKLKRDDISSGVFTIKLLRS
jgi:hypothetical protein